MKTIENQQAFEEAVLHLAQLDNDFDFIIKTHGIPPFWQREPGFAALVFIILEQQVSIASAKATFDKLNKTIDLNPSNFLKLNDFDLKNIGFSRQKIEYSRNLALEIENGTLNLDALHQLDTPSVTNELTRLKGIGQWTADVYLMLCMNRADILPVGDLALQIAVQRIKNQETRPKGIELIEIAEPWRPFRSVATRILWHFYLSK